MKHSKRFCIHITIVENLTKKQPVLQDPAPEAMKVLFCQKEISHVFELKSALMTLDIGYPDSLITLQPACQSLRPSLAFAFRAE